MPNLILEKDGQTFRFGLHEEKSVTRGKYITVPFNGREYYARYGDASTPLKAEIKGREHSIQYDPVDFQTISWQGTTNNTKVAFFPKGRYVVNMLLHQYKRIEIYIGESGEKAITVTITYYEGRISSYRLTIDGVFNEVIYTNYSGPSYWIERIGD